jgi:adenylate cyclase
MIQENQIESNIHPIKDERSFFEMIKSKTGLRIGATLMIVSVLILSSCGKKPRMYVDHGQLDLREYSFKDHPIIDLDGKWEFYWNRLLTPLDFSQDSAFPLQPDSYINVPDSWNSTLINNQQITGTGYATYRVKILLPENRQNLALKLLDAGSSYRIWIDGHLKKEIGLVGTDAKSSQASYQTTVIEIPETGPQLELVIQVANFHHRKGGLWEIVKLGTSDAIQSYRNYRIIFAGFLAGSLAVMGLYHLGLFLIRRKDFSPLWFGLFCIDISLRTMLTGERILHGFVPAYSWEWMVKLEYITVMMGTPFLLFFFRSLYPAEISRNRALIPAVLSYLLALFILVTPAIIYSYVVLINPFVILLAVLIGNLGLIRGVLHHREGAFIFFLTGQIFLVTVLNDILYNLEIIFTFQMIGYGLLFFVFSQSFLLSMKFSKAFIIVEALSENLKHQNIAYRRFLPGEFLHLLKKDNIVDIQLGDQVQMEMSVLFVDIRSFTTLSEGMTAKESFDFLNAFLSHIGPLIRQNNGFIDKYIGDGLMALFPGTAEDALKAAIGIQNELVVFNKEMTDSNQPSIRVGSAIHTGRLMLGTVGEHERMDATVISDAVNLASRLEGLTRSYGACIILSGETLSLIEDPSRYFTRFLGRVKVRGKMEPVSIFEVFDLDTMEVRNLKQSYSADFEKGLRLMNEGQLDEALRLFEGIHMLNPGDIAALLYIQKIEKIQSYLKPSDISRLIDLDELKQG